MKPKRRRLTFVLIGMGLLGAATALMLMAFRNDIVFFYSPTEVYAKTLAPGQRIRVGGLVEKGSVKKSANGETVHFVVTDLSRSVPVVYTGILPDLFREGQGVVVQGRFSDGTFVADQVLAKHDARYMPPEVAAELKKSGHWQQWQQMKEAMQAAGQIPKDPAR